MTSLVTREPKNFFASVGVTSSHFLVTGENGDPSVRGD
jgi:hypothetical protein